MTHDQAVKTCDYLSLTHNGIRVGTDDGVNYYVVIQDGSPKDGVPLPPRYQENSNGTT